MTKDPGKKQNKTILRDWGEENEQGSKTYFTGELVVCDILRAKELMSSWRQM